MRGTIPISAMLMAALVLATGCRTMTGQSLGTNIDNKSTTAAVKTRLAAEQLQNLGWVDVDTNAGTVYLSGTASSEQQKRRAEEIAGAVDGVERVVNNIEVRPTASTGGPSAAAGGARSTTTDVSPATAMSASPATSDGTRRYTASGEVLSVDRDSGQLTIRSSTGPVVLHVPESALEGIQVGDRVDVELGIRQLP